MRGQKYDVGADDRLSGDADTMLHVPIADCRVFPRAWIE